MQVANLFRETAKLLGASMDGGGGSSNNIMDNSKYCGMKSQSGGGDSDGYETCVDTICGGLHMDSRMLGGSEPPPLPLPPHSMRSLVGLDDHHHHQHHHHNHPHQQHHEHSISKQSQLQQQQHHQQQQQQQQQQPPQPHGLMKHDQYSNRDPYSFVDEMPICLPHHHEPNHNSTTTYVSQVKKRGRRKKPDNRNEEYNKNNTREEAIMDAKERKRHDRFDGLSEEEVSQRSLPDHLSANLDILIIGINPGLFAAFKGHHYAGPGNHFWKCLYLSKLVPEPFTADDDYNLLHYGIGFTNMVSRPTKGSADLTRREIKQGSKLLLEKLQKFRPKIAVFNGKLIYEVFSGKKDFPFGRQQEFVDGTNTYIWVMPSSSARCAQLPRAADKVPFYSALKKFRDYLNGLIANLDESEVVFNDSKPSNKGANGESKLSLEAASAMREDEQRYSDATGCGKKKRGRPRKGMEKQKKGKFDGDENENHNYLKNNDKCGRGDLVMENSNDTLRPGERKRRGRPKKPKVVPGKGTSTAPNFPLDTLENGTTNNTGVCPTQTSSSVSSGYSTGTNASSEERRRDENGSLSNAGSGGPSPSHHSFTTQSDLSSEISAAISCGSPAPSPLNNGQHEPSFDSHTRGEDSSGHYSNSKSGFRGTGSLYPPPPHPSRSSNNDPVGSSYHPYNHQYDNRPHNNLSSRAPTYHPPASRGGGNSEAQVYPNTFEPKPLDVASKSLSGLESLVDQIPSIAEADISLPPVSSGCLSSLMSDSMPQSFSHLTGVPTSMAHGSHFNDSPSGFLPYSHGPSSSYSTAPHYASSSYYASELSSAGFGPTYCSPSAPSSLMFGYPGYHSQYTSGGSGYPHSTTAGLHLTPPTYGAGYPPPGYPNPYPHAHSMASAAVSGQQRYAQRYRQDGMDLGHMGFGGF